MHPIINIYIRGHDIGEVIEVLLVIVVRVELLGHILGHTQLTAHSHLEARLLNLSQNGICVMK